MSAATIVAQLASGATGAVRLALSTTSDLTAGVYVDGTPDEDDIVRFNLSDLAAGTTYHYCVEVNGILITPRRGTFRTQSDGAAFKFLCGSCQQAPVIHPVFTAMRAEGADLLLHMGDLGYPDIDTDDASLFRANYRDALYASPPMAQLARSLTTAYVWDDHDYGADDSAASSPSRPAAITTYRQCVPHYTLPDDEGVYQTFAWNGLVRFILLDVRAFRVQTTNMLGLDQMAWLKAQLSAATEPVICLATIVPWLVTDDGWDNWGAYTDERDEIADYLVSEGLASKTFIVNGDAHSLAIDDGTNNEWGGVPVFQAAPFRQGAIVRGGPYTYGPEPPSSGGLTAQYGLVTVTPGEGEVTIKFDGYRVSDAGTKTLMMSHEFAIST